MLMRLPSLSIRNRIALLVVAVVCGLTTVLLLLVRLELLPEVRAQALHRLEDAARNVSRDLARDIDDKLTDVVHYARLAPTVTAALGQDVQRRWLSSLLTRQDGYVWLGMAMEDGTILASSDLRLEGFRPEDERWLRDGLEAPAIADIEEVGMPPSAGFVDLEGRPLELLRLTAPIPGRRGRTMGVLVMFLDNRRIDALTTELASRLEHGSQARLTVAGRDGRARFGRPLPPWLEVAAAEDALPYKVVTNPEGHEHAMLRVPVPPVMGVDLGWTVILHSDLVAVEGPLRQMESFLLTAGGLTILLTLLLALPVAAAITRPIGILVQAAEGYAGGGSVPAMPVARFPPELGRLAHALKMLVVVLHRRRKELHQSRGRLVRALAAGRQIAWEYDVARGSTRIEGLQGTWLGWSARELTETSESWLVFVHPDDRDRVEGAMARFVASGEDHIVLQYRMAARDGRYCWVEDHALVAEQDRKGRAARLAGTVIDIDAQKAVEQRLQESESRAMLQLAEIAGIYDQAPIGLSMVDREFRFLRINPCLAALNGFTVEEHVGRLLPDLLPELWPTLEPLYQRVRDTGEPVEAVEVEGETPAAPGVRRTFVASYFPIKDARGAIVGIGTMVEDVTPRKRAEAAERAKSAFLAMMSHEIRTPLTAILGFADLLAAAELAEEQRRQVAIIRDTGRMLLTIINDILDFSKLEAGKTSLETAPFALCELLESCLRTAELLGAERGLTFRLEIGASVPDRVAGDAIRLKQILTNLLGNAVKFTAKGGVTLSATVVGEEAGSVRLRFEVEDTGIGIAPERLPKLFAMFEQADQSITRRFGGTGLGLAICKRLAEAMGGRVGARSKPGVGSTFWVELPLARVSAAAPEEPKHVAATGAPLRRGRILVVDDIVTNRMLLDALLRGQGQEVALARDGVEAVEVAARQPFDLILMDVHMPRQDGLAASRAIRASDGPNAGTPIVALTAAVLEEEIAACREAGMTDHLAKPVDPKRLAGLLASHVGARAAA
jgi:PAS domain S-box-containing protein